MPISLILMDIDFFKPYNDTLGHQAGDACLRRVATALTLSLHRPGDLAARYGGEEFVVVLGNTGVKGARAVAESIRERIASFGIPHPASPISDRLTISVGIASMVPPLGSRPERLILLADQALYRAKGEGRNCVRVAESLQTLPEGIERS